MPRTHPRMKLSLEERAFLQQWMYDEVHFLEGQGPAKRLQVAQGVRPAELALLIVAAIPDPAEQQAAAMATASAIAWPWSGSEFRDRLEEARQVISARQHMSAAG